MLRRTFVVTTLLLGGCAAHAHRPVTPLADVQVIDRTTGERLPVYGYRGERWIAGMPGHRYAVEIANRSNERVLAVVAVDGVNAVTGETAGWDQNGYVFAPWQRWEVRGWRKSNERVAAFEFTALPNSYAARTGRPDHVGVIGVALFRERPRPQPVPAAPAVREQRRDAPAAEPGAAAPPARDEAAGAAAPSARSAEADNSARQALALRKSERLGTGHGASEQSYVSSTEFERLQPTPEQVVTIRYDSRENLLALGIIPPAPIAMPTPRPFPGSGGFVPDPPR